MFWVNATTLILTSTYFVMTISIKHLIVGNLFHTTSPKKIHDCIQYRNGKTHYTETYDSNVSILLQNHPQRYEKLICCFILTLLPPTKIRWLERDLNSHLRVSRPPLYPLSYRVNGDWWRVLSNLSGRNIFATT